MQSRRRQNPRGLTMQRWSATLAISLLLAFQAPNLGAQDTSASGPALTNKQIELVRKVTVYFNQLTSLKGMFIQTGPDNKRQRGKFYISRPGRFRFEFNLPSKVVIISDGKYIAIQDHDLNTDDRWDLSYTPFRALLQKDVDLLRDTRILEAQVVDNTIVISFEDRGGDASNRIKLFLAATPELQIKGWIVKDAQGLETRVDLMDISGAGELDAKLFDPAM